MNTISIERARARCQNRNKEDEASSSVADVSERESEEAQPAKKMLISTLSKLGAATTSMGVGSRNPHVLPHICIICKSEKLYVTETVSFLFCTVFDHIFVVETSQSSQESDYALDSDDEGHTNIHDTKTATLQEMYAVSLKLRNIYSLL